MCWVTLLNYWDNVTNECHCELLLNDWKPVGDAQEDGDVDLSLPPCFISFTRPTSVFIYFCPSSGVNKTPCCRRGAWVMRLVSLKALLPAGHGSTSETRGKWMCCLRDLFIRHFYVNVCMSVHLCGPVTLATLYSVIGNEIRYNYLIYCKCYILATNINK